MSVHTYPLGTRLIKLLIEENLTMELNVQYLTHSMKVKLNMPSKHEVYKDMHHWFLSTYGRTLALVVVKFKSQAC